MRTYENREELILTKGQAIEKKVKTKYGRSETTKKNMGKQHLGNNLET